MALKGLKMKRTFILSTQCLCLPLRFTSLQTCTLSDNKYPNHLQIRDYGFLFLSLWHSSRWLWHTDRCIQNHAVPRRCGLLKKVLHIILFQPKSGGKTGIHHRIKPVSHQTQESVGNAISLSHCPTWLHVGRLMHAKAPRGWMVVTHCVQHRKLDM